MVIKRITDYKDNTKQNELTKRINQSSPFERNDLYKQKDKKKNKNMSLIKNRYFMSAPAALSELANIERELRNFLYLSKVPEKEHYYIVLAVNEAVINIIQHAYKNKENGKIDLDFIGRCDSVSIKIRDYAPAQNPDSFKGRALNDPKPSGLGLHLIRSFMDHVSFHPIHTVDKEGMELILEKKIG